MSNGFEWGGYAAQPLSGVSEALDAAGIDCVIHQHEVGEDASDIRQRWWEPREAPTELSQPVQ